MTYAAWIQLKKANVRIEKKSKVLFSLFFLRVPDPLNVTDIMDAQDKKLFNKILPKPKPQQYNLRRKVCHRPKIDTESFKNTFVNRLIFEYNLL